MEGSDRRERKKILSSQGAFIPFAPTLLLSTLFVYLWSAEAEFQGSMISLVVKNCFVLWFSSSFNYQILLCHSPNRHGNSLRIWDELTYFKKKCASYSASHFSFCCYFYLFKPNVMRTFPWVQAKQIKNSEGHFCFPTCLSEEKIEPSKCFTSLAFTCGSWWIPSVSHHALLSTALYSRNHF